MDLLAVSFYLFPLFPSNKEGVTVLLPGCFEGVLRLFFEKNLQKADGDVRVEGEREGEL